MLNSNQKAIRKGYAQMAKQLGSTMSVYRPREYKYAPALDPKNWLFDIPFSASSNSGYQGTVQYGLPAIQGFFDSTKVESGDVFTDGVRTFFVGQIPLFEPPMVVECFNAFTCVKREWDNTTRTFVETVIVREAPCHLESTPGKGLVRDNEAGGNPDTQMTWTVRTWLPDGLVSINDKLIFDHGFVAQVSDIFRSQHGLTIKAVQIMGEE